MAGMSAGGAQIDFVTFGMFIIDQIHFPSSGLTVDDVVGGGGTFGVVGARLFSPGPASKTIGWIVDAGDDFPDKIREELEKWDTNLIIRETPGRLTTRGWNSYGPGDFRAFKYLTPKIRLEPKDFVSNLLLRSASYHLICSPSRCNNIITNLTEYRISENIVQKPILIWEPVPDLCTPDQLEECLRSLRLVSLVSPNAAELGAFYGLSDVESEKKEILEANAEKWYLSGISSTGDGAIIVRAGKDGCYVRHGGGKIWLPAYFTDEDKDKVVDPTGGGNSFIGGLAVGIVRTKDIVLAAAYATVAASFAIEQIGMPVLSFENGRELWNQVGVEQRLERYLEKINLFNSSA